MLIYAEKYSPECIPHKIKADMKIVLFSMAALAAIFLLTMMWIGGTA